MKNKKGFTLIELLAIIVILAIIAVITVPIILNIIDNAKAGAITNSVHGYKDAINKYYLSTLSTGGVFNNFDGEYTINSDGNIVKDSTEYNIDVSGNKPNGGTLSIVNKSIVSGCVQIDGYYVTISEGNIGQAQKGDCSGS